MTGWARPRAASARCWSASDTMAGDALALGSGPRGCAIREQGGVDRPGHRRELDEEHRGRQPFKEEQEL